MNRRSSLFHQQWFARRAHASRGADDPTDAAQEEQTYRYARPELTTLLSPKDMAAGAARARSGVPRSAPDRPLATSPPVALDHRRNPPQRMPEAPPTTKKIGVRLAGRSLFFDLWRTRKTRLKPERCTPQSGDYRLYQLAYRKFSRSALPTKSQ